MIEIESAKSHMQSLEIQLQAFAVAESSPPKKDSPQSHKRMGRRDSVWTSSSSEVGNIYNLVLGPEPYSWTRTLRTLIKTKGKNHAVSYLGQKEALDMEADIVRHIVLHLFVSWTTSAQKKWYDQNPKIRKTCSWLDANFLACINDHTYDYMVAKFGVIPLAEAALRAFSSTLCKASVNGDRRCYIFARMCGLDPSAYNSPIASGAIASYRVRLFLIGYDCALGFATP